MFAGSALIKYGLPVILVSVAGNWFLFKQWQAERLRAELLDGQLRAVKERTAIRRAGEQHRIEVKQISSSTEWGRVAVPDDVKRVLCERADCAELPPTDSRPNH